MALFGQSFREVIQFKKKSLQWDLIQQHCCAYKKQKSGDRLGGSHMKIRAGIENCFYEPRNVSALLKKPPNWTGYMNHTVHPRSQKEPILKIACKDFEPTAGSHSTSVL